MQLKDRIIRLFGLTTPVGDDAGSGEPAEAANTEAGAPVPEDLVAGSEAGAEDADTVADPEVDVADKAPATENGA